MARSKPVSKSKSVEVVEDADAGEKEVAAEQLEGEEEAGDDEDDDDEEEGEEYEVETILEHRNRGGGKYEYLVSWKGYGPEHNTWEPQEHVEHASEVVTKYWASKPKAEIGVKKRGRASVASSTPVPKNKSARTAGRTSAGGSGNGNGVGASGRKSKAAEADTDEEEADYVPYSESHVDPMTKYEDVEDWEELVASIDSVERGSENELMAYITMTGGEKCTQPCSIANTRCPQKMLQFYESHLKWRGA